MDTIWTLEAWIEHCRAQRFDDQRALEIAHNEYLRRLHELNNEAGRIAARDSMYISVDKFDDNNEAIGATHDTFVVRYEAAHAALADKIEAFERRYVEAHQTLIYELNQVRILVREGIAEQSGIRFTWGKIMAIVATTAAMMGALGTLIYAVVSSM